MAKKKDSKKKIDKFVNVRMLATYAGPQGCFAKDCIYDLPASKLAKLPKGSFRREVMPWEKKAKTKGSAGNAGQ